MSLRIKFDKSQKKSRKIKVSVLIFLFVCFYSVNIFAATDTYTVQIGDTLWGIAKKYHVGISEIVKANSQIKTPDKIYPGDRIIIPLTDTETTNVEQQVANLVNQYRAKNGLSTLNLNWELSRIARYKSQDMCDRNYFDHNSPTYGSPFDMLKKFNINYQTAGENIAKGQKSAEAVVNSWMNSEGHRANILNKNFTQIGVGYYNKNGVTYWTQLFIKTIVN